ncbi:hypothetical protein GF359_01910 [candidate division WOR-3 bacterium]|uniref:CD-NTase-associated protein 12/Pycsar effector protein TIR domain-containing protein n=1 Tax=candidate division WOR-3 bacterium TaxID=2052148 RepID=A0A9D5K9B5_UNCW3|nr:hypothetical protein [candidate division WOR-3 bacterium]MBD3363949.1 hypothetical protein [candidate division WOR-3 bacterium]
MKISPAELAKQLRVYHEGLSKEAHKLKDDGMSLPLEFAIETVRLWKEEVTKFLADSGAADFAAEFSEVPLPQHGLLEELHQSVDNHLAKLDAIITELSPEQEVSTEAQDNPGKRIFVVHGRDTTNVFELMTMLKQRYSLECVNVETSPEDIGEQVEKLSRSLAPASFAFIFMAPYDMVKVEKRDEYVQASAGVLFKLGWFYARLGREKVCILSKKGVEVHPDLEGVQRIGFDTSVTEKAAEIEAKLKAAGII